MISQCKVKSYENVPQSQMEVPKAQGFFLYDDKCKFFLTYSSSPHPPPPCHEQDYVNATVLGKNSLKATYTSCIVFSQFYLIKF